VHKLALALTGLGLAATAVGGVAAHALTSDDTAGGGSTAPNATTTAARTSDPSGAHTRLGTLAPATGDPVPAGIETAAPAAGQVRRLGGPFDDRFRWERLRVAEGQVSGSVRVISDVSDLLELQVVVGFYDARGRYLGLARYSHHLEEGTHAHQGPPEEVESFTLRAPTAFRAKVASATVSVPVLVNE
jgi:hypothetical protein